MQRLEVSQIDKKKSTSRTIGKWVFWNPCFKTDCRDQGAGKRPAAQDKNSEGVNSRFRPYRKFPHLSITNSVTRRGGSINIIQVTVYSFTVPALKLMKVKFCLFLATTAHCHDRAAIKIHITTFNRINLHVRCGNLHNFNCFWLSIY